MALINSDQVYIRLADNEGDVSQTSINVVGTIDLTQRTALLAAVADLSIGAIVEQGYADRAVENSTKRSTNVLAQSDIRWRLVYQTANGLEYTHTVGAADLSLKAQGQELMDTTTPEYIAIKTLFDLHGRSPDGDAVTLMRIEYYKV